VIVFCFFFFALGFVVGFLLSGIMIFRDLKKIRSILNETTTTLDANRSAAFNEKVEDPK